MSTFNRNFNKLVQLGVISQQGDLSFTYGKSMADGYMDWNVEHLGDGVPNNNEGFVLSLTHYFEQNGDLCKDPDMVIAVYPKQKAVEALSYQMDIPPIYQEVYPEPGKVIPALKKELNCFLSQWLDNLVAQGHGKHWNLQVIA
ncbi:MAG: DUF1249 domain-containing protein [Pseudomonadales bacterium]|nr:DUF1249 domain-containing protein [Pseudomonadales bacterium]